MVKNKKSRITASHFYQVCIRLKESEEYYISKMIIRKGPNMSTAFDTLHEPIAKQLHFNQYKKKNSIKMQKSGYAVDCRP